MGVNVVNVATVRTFREVAISRHPASKVLVVLLAMGVVTSVAAVAARQLDDRSGTSPSGDRPAYNEGTRAARGATSARSASTAQPRIVHVRTRHASDRNPGTEERPVRTIKRGVAIAVLASSRGRPARVVVHPGIYREGGIVIPSGPRDAGRLTLTAKRKGTVIVSGSDVWGGWQQHSQQIYKHAWSYNWGTAPIPSDWEGTYAEPQMQNNPVIRRREMIFVDGESLYQVMSYGELQRSARPAFYVEESNDVVYIKLNGDRTPEDSRIEVATRSELVNVARNNVAIHGFRFQHANSSLEGRAVSIHDVRNVTILDNRFLWNNWFGLHLAASRNITVERNVANHNGSGGITAFHLDDLSMIRNETSFNNWRGVRGWDQNDHSKPVDPNLVDFASGQKFFGLFGARFVGHRSIGNFTGGLWFDYGHRYVTIENSLFKNNMTHGVFFEASRGPFEVRDSAFCSNETGILFGNSENGTIRDSVFRRNVLSGMFVAGVAGERSVRERGTDETVNLITRNWTLLDNTVSVEGDQRVMSTYLTDDWDTFVGTLMSNGNRWLHDGDPDVFQVKNGEILDLAGWRTHSGQDEDSKSSEGDTRCGV